LGNPWSGHHGKKLGRPGGNPLQENPCIGAPAGDSLQGNPWKETLGGDHMDGISWRVHPAGDHWKRTHGASPLKGTRGRDHPGGSHEWDHLGTRGRSMGRLPAGAPQMELLEGNYWFGPLWVDPWRGPPVCEPLDLTPAGDSLEGTTWTGPPGWDPWRGPLADHLRDPLEKTHWRRPGRKPLEGTPCG
jgi:hypothetical protein